jgi:aminoglycoside phosphotransferase (APT) family kinase protein
VTVSAADVVATAGEAAALERPPLLVLEPLAAFLDEHAIGDGELDVAPIGDGHSNVTFEVRRSGAHVVVRRPPRPPYPPSAHDVLREAGLLLALGGAGVRVPRVLATCEDSAVLGAPFYVMEHVEGHVVTQTLPAALDADGARAAIATELVNGLAELHAVDYEAAGLGGFGRPDGYLERQLRRFGSIWQERRTREVPDVDRTAAWLADRVPASRDASVVHGDFRLGNVILAPSAPARLVAILDWEMSTLGDPLADLGYLVASWARPGDEDTPMLALSEVTRQDGFPERDELEHAYATVTGRDVDGLGWYEVLALWKSAIFLEASYARFLEGTTDDPYFATLDEGVPALGRAAAARIAQLGG